MKGRFSSNFYINNSFTPLESIRLKSLFDSSILIRSSRLPALRRRTSKSPLQNLILSRRRWHLLGLKFPSNSLLTNSRD
ncbi:hypothetical protein Taro_040011 [Colocasia esculenta]|uniref:Uncharacterized protein n=1 Tax=Colocasia esculenta TaxID=4460 RepID=A0A843WAS3_COLES|nr:hypothetical protein [Colocasia esculenta]